MKNKIYALAFSLYAFSNTLIFTDDIEVLEDLESSSASEEADSGSYSAVVIPPTYKGSVSWQDLFSSNVGNFKNATNALCAEVDKIDFSGNRGVRGKKATLDDALSVIKKFHSPQDPTSFYNVLTQLSSNLIYVTEADALILERSFARWIKFSAKSLEGFRPNQFGVRPAKLATALAKSRGLLDSGHIEVLVGQSFDTCELLKGRLKMISIFKAQSPKAKDESLVDVSAQELLMKLYTLISFERLFKLYSLTINELDGLRDDNFNDFLGSEIISNFNKIFTSPMLNFGISKINIKNCELASLNHMIKTLWTGVDENLGANKISSKIISVQNLLLDLKAIALKVKNNSSASVNLDFVQMFLSEKEQSIGDYINGSGIKPEEPFIPSLKNLAAILPVNENNQLRAGESLEK